MLLNWMWQISTLYERSLLLTFFADPCKFVACQKHNKCEVRAEGSTQCVCQSRDECPIGGDSVCGSNGTTYENECDFKAAACGTDLKMKKGKCGKKELLFCLCQGLELFRYIATVRENQLNPLIYVLKYPTKTSWFILVKTLIIVYCQLHCERDR